MTRRVWRCWRKTRRVLGDYIAARKAYQHLVEVKGDRGLGQ